MTTSTGRHGLGPGVHDPSAFALEDEFCIESKPDTYALAGDRPRLTTAELYALFAPPQD